MLVEDDIDLNYTNRCALELHGYAVLSALTLGEARDILRKKEPDAILLDVTLPDGDGFSFCREIRSQTRAHILFLTAMSEPKHLLAGFDAGGDDFMTKPFHVLELLARVAAVMRRRGIADAPRLIEKGRLLLDTVSGQATIDGEDLLLSPKEFSVLCLFVRHEGVCLSAERIYGDAWGRHATHDTNAVKMTVSRLRSKLRDSGRDIRTVRGHGYVFGSA